MQLSARLEKLIELAGSGRCAADIGTDHALVPVELMRRGAFERAVAGDLRKGPLAAASVHVRQAGLAERISLRLGDGLHVLEPGEADVILISGMGGALMQRILTEGEVTAKAARRLVLSPQSEIPEFRGFLQESGYRITSEAAVYEDRKFYFLMTAERGGQTLWEGADRLYGRLLLEEGSGTVLSFARRRKAVLERILRNLEKTEKDKAEARRQEAEEELRLTEEALLRLTSTQR